MKRKATAWWVGVAVALLAAQSGAQTATGAGQEQGAGTEAITTLAPVVVTGQVIQTELPEGTTVTTRQTLDERAVNSWDDFSNRVAPGVNFSRQNNSVNIRGMDADRVVTTIDGIELPWITDGARGTEGGLNSVDFNSLAAIDVMGAAGAVQSGMLAGTLGLRSLMPDDLLGPDKDFGARVKSDYDGADDSWGTNVALAGRINDDTTWLLQAGIRKGRELENMGDVGGYGENRTEPDPGNYTQHDLRLVLQHKLDSSNTLTLSGESFRHKFHTKAYSMEGEDEAYEIGTAETQENISRDRVVLGYGYSSTNPHSVVNSGDVKLYWQRMRLDDSVDGTRPVDARANIPLPPIPIFPPGHDPYGYGYPSGFYSRTNSIQESGLGGVTRWDGFFSTAVAQHWKVGGELYSSRTWQNSDGEDNCPDTLPSYGPPILPAPFGPRTCEFLHTNQSDMPKVDGLKWALWAQDEFSWSEGKYALTPALRFDYYRYSPQSGGSYESNPNSDLDAQSPNSDSHASPSILARYQPQDDLSFYAKFGYGYKAPNAAQLYLNYGAPGTYLSKGNPNLKPEISHGWELGTDVGNESLGAHLAYFDNRYRDFIDSVNLGNSPEYPMFIQSYANRAHVRIYGVEFTGHWSVTDNWYTWGSLAWSHGTDQDTDQYLNSVAPLKAAVAVGYKTDVWGTEALLNMAAARDHVEYPDTDYEAPGYGVFNLTGWYKPPVVKGLRIQAGIYNMFDKKYWNALDVPDTNGSAGLPRPVDFYSAPGRNIRVSLIYQY